MAFRVSPAKKLVTGGSVMAKTSEREVAKPPFVHPMMAESLRSGSGGVVAQRNVRRAIKRAKAVTG
jgi:hypothetical protein